MLRSLTNGFKKFNLSTCKQTWNSLGESNLERYATACMLVGGLPCAIVVPVVCFGGIIYEHKIMERSVPTLIVENMVLSVIMLPGVGSIEEGIAIYRGYYSKEDEDKYGVVATEISLD